MAGRKLPPDERLAQTGISLPREHLAACQFLAEQRGPRMSMGGIIREAVAEYLARRLGPVGEPERVPA